jgi:hypothetical protein
LATPDQNIFRIFCSPYLACYSCDIFDCQRDGSGMQIYDIADILAHTCRLDQIALVSGVGPGDPILHRLDLFVFSCLMFL